MSNLDDVVVVVAFVLCLLSDMFHYVDSSVFRILCILKSQILATPCLYLRTCLIFGIPAQLSVFRHLPHGKSSPKKKGVACTQYINPEHPKPSTDTGPSLIPLSALASQK